MATSLSLLFLGNSYTMNQNLDQTVAAMLSERGTAATSARLTSGGLTFESHVERAEGGHADWESALTDKAESWDWIFLQEQSQIPGFPEHNAYVVGSVAAAGILDGYAQDRGAQTVFVMTWGRRFGDPDNPERYVDFTTMQDLLTAGYTSYVEAWSTQERPVWIAPAGLAWQHIHDDILASGEDPLMDGSLFALLYQPDGSHPSPAGNHLNAAVIYATITGESPVGLADPSGQLKSEVVLQLQEVAAAVVLGDSPDIDYPWEKPGDTTPTDTGDPADTGKDTNEPEVEDTDTTGAGSGEDDDPAPTEEATGCRSYRALALPVLFLMLLGVRRR